MRNNVIFDWLFVSESATKLRANCSHTLSHALSHVPYNQFKQRSKQINVFRQRRILKKIKELNMKKKKKYWKENFSLNLRAYRKASKDYCLEYIWETSVSTLRLVQYYNGSKYKRYLIERLEIRSIRTAIVRLPNSVEHNRTHNKVLSIDHSIAGHLLADYERDASSNKID